MTFCAYLAFVLNLKIKAMVGRKEELDILKSLEQTDESAFVAVYGRRRVGKTYLIRHVFDEKFTFHLTGIANIGLKPQYTGKRTRGTSSDSWYSWYSSTGSHPSASTCGSTRPNLTCVVFSNK